MLRICWPKQPGVPPPEVFRNVPVPSALALHFLCIINNNNNKAIDTHQTADRPAIRLEAPGAMQLTQTILIQCTNGMLQGSWTAQANSQERLETFMHALEHIFKKGGTPLEVE